MRDKTPEAMGVLMLVEAWDMQAESSFYVTFVLRTTNVERAIDIVRQELAGELAELREVDDEETRLVQLRDVTPGWRTDTSSGVFGRSGRVWVAPELN